MLCLKYSLPLITKVLDSAKISSTKKSSVVVCGLRGPRPRYPRVWKTNKRIGTISKSKKLVDCIKGLSNVKEEVYGALDSFIAWELEFPLITVKKALKTLEDQQEWKRIIQMIKWMLSKGQGRTMGTYFTLLNALAEDGRLEEAEELWKRLFMQNLEHTPRVFFDKMISIYYRREMYDKMFEIFADMEELEIKPNISVVAMVGNVFQKLAMLDKYEKLKMKYPPPKWEYRYVKGKRVKVRVNQTSEFEILKQLGEPDNSKQIDGSNKLEELNEFDDAIEGTSKNEETDQSSNEVLEDAEASSSNDSFDDAETSFSNELFDNAETS